MYAITDGMNDTLVFDIETQNFFTSPDVGWDNFEALKISVVGVYSYARNEYFCFEEHEVENMSELFQNARRLVGFAQNRYDVPVLNLYFKKFGGPNLWAMERVDLLDEVIAATGNRISLSRLAESNLGVKKDRHGSEAIGLYARGEIEELKKYCLKDVEITKNLFDLYERDRQFLVPDKNSGELITIKFPRNSPLFSTT